MRFSQKVIYKLEDITKVFQSERGKVSALENVSFDIDEGELVVVVGPSGCGKTTLLRILAHLIRPTSGKLIFKSSTRSSFNEDKFGFVFQDPTLMPWRTVIDNVILPLEVEGESKDAMYKKARELLKLLNLEQFEKYYPYELSGGMSQRVAIARALISDPPVLLMDEPFSALDEVMRQKLNFELLDIKRMTNKTIVFVTHNILEAVILADKIVILGLNPNTVIESRKISLSKRTPKLLTNPVFYRTVEKLRKIIEKHSKEKTRQRHASAY